MTPDQDLSARLAQLKADEDSHDLAEAFYRTLDTALWVAYDQGQLITLADHERAVQDAVTKAVEACVARIQKERADCKANPNFQEDWAEIYDDGLADAAIVIQHPDFAAAIRSRGVEG